MITAVPEINDPMGVKHDHLLFTRDGEPIEYGEFIDGHDEKSGSYVQHDVARLEKGIPNPKIRPVLPAPWELEFVIHLFPNNEIDLQELYNLFSEGGYALGLGTFRGVYGKFEVAQWDIVE